MDNADPEVNSLDAELSGENIHVTGNVRAVRTCADCSTELKSLDIDFDEEFGVTELSGYAELTDDQKAKLQSALADELEEAELEVEIDELSSSTEESGGARYKKNLITTVVEADVTVTLKLPDEEITFSGVRELKHEAAASEYEECC